MSKRNNIMNNSSINNKKNIGKIENLSIKEQMMGVKSTKPLPKDFYEKILPGQCEMGDRHHRGILPYALHVQCRGDTGRNRQDHGADRPALRCIHVFRVSVVHAGALYGCRNKLKAIS